MRLDHIFLLSLTAKAAGAVACELLEGMADDGLVIKMVNAGNGACIKVSGGSASNTSTTGGGNGIV